jgi:hypothetical protein
MKNKKKPTKESNKERVRRREKRNKELCKHDLLRKSWAL